MSQNAPQPSDASFRELLSILGHELRSPLTVVRGAATLLQEAYDDLPRERADEMLALIDKHVESMSNRIEDLIAVCHIDAGDTRLVMQDVELADLLRPLLEWTAAHAPSRGVNAPEPQPGLRVHADWERSQQVLRALIDNAIRYSPPESPVEIETGTTESGKVAIRVLDRGPGVPEEQRELIFQRMGKRDGAGPGLGLYMARGLARAMGGEVDVADRDGGGAIFSFTLNRHG
jgi:two-component system sensor histidine kinase KdpD